MPKWMGLFQIGPVQDFIQTARKVQDYWSGSYLLSYLCGEAMTAVKPYPVCFPIPPPRGRKGRLAIPNRFVAILEATDDIQAKEIMANAVYRADASWKAVAQEVAAAFNEITGFDVEGGSFGVEWNNQISHAFEYLWVILQWDGQDATYKDNYGNLERLLGARKATRWFESPLPPGGPPCSLCGRRLAILKGDPASVPPPPRPQVSASWKEFRTKKFATRFRDGERLCSVCLIKRLAPDHSQAYGGRPAVPSTSTLAVSGFLKATMGMQSTLQSKWDLFKREIDNSILPQVVGEPSQGGYLLGMRKHYLAGIEGDWLIKDSYERFVNKTEVKNDPIAQSACANLFKSLQDNILAPAIQMVNAGILSRDQLPGKYYAIVTFDGDCIGEKLANIPSLRAHQDFSECMGNFATKISDVVEVEHAGFLGYAGGDEGLAFSALCDLLPLLRRLRLAWEEHVMKPLKEMGLPSPSLSAGAVIAHHQQSMGRVITEAFDAIDAAKSFEDRDAFAVTILRRSGAPLIARSRWLLSIHDSGDLTTVTFLESLVDLYQHKKLSPRWFRDLLAMERILEDPPHTMEDRERRDLVEGPLKRLFENEARRVVNRHWASEVDKKEHSEKMVANLALLRQGLWLAYVEDPFRETMNLMDLVQFIAQGGVR